MRHFLILAVLLFLSSAVSAASIPPIEELLTEEELERTGVGRLSAEEQQALREWLDVFIEQDAKFVRRAYRKQQQEAAKVRRKEQKDRERTAAGNNEQVETGESGPASGGGQDLDTEAASEPEKKPVVESRLVGEFTGWSGRTQFTLENGQVWQQRRRDSQRRVRPVQDPAVRIDTNFLGFHVMEFPDLGIKLPVKRIQ